MMTEEEHARSLEAKISELMEKHGFMSPKEGEDYASAIPKVIDFLDWMSEQICK